MPDLQVECTHDDSEHAMAMVALAVAREALELAHTTGQTLVVYDDEHPEEGMLAEHVIESALAWFRERCAALSADPGDAAPA